MSTFDQLTLNKHARRDIAATSLPPLPVEGETELGVARGVSENRRLDVGRVTSVLGQIGKAIALPFTMSLEGLERTDSLFRTTILTAMGKVDRSRYFDYASEVIKGERTVTGAAFLELAFGFDAQEQFGDTNLLPFWTKEVINPLTGVKEERPKISLGGLLGFGAEMFVSPFAAVSVLPKSVVQATKIGKAMDIMTYPLSKPLELFGRAITSTDHGLGVFLFRLGDPRRSMANFTRQVGEGADGFEMLAKNGKDMVDASGFIRDGLTELGKKHGIVTGLIGKMRGLQNKEINSARLWKHVFISDQTLNKAEQAFMNDLVPVLKQWQKRLEDAGSNRIAADANKPIKASQRAGWSGPDLSKDGFEVFDADRYLLRQFMGHPKNYRRETFRVKDIAQGDKPFDQRMEYMLHWAGGKADGTFPFQKAMLENRIPDAQLDILHSLDVWMQSASKRSILHHPKTGVLHKNNFGPTANFGKEGQNPNLVGLRDFEFNYWLEKVHQLTGNRPRKAEVIFDRAMARFHQNVTDFMRGTHKGNRMLEYMSKRIGQGGGRMIVEKSKTLSDPTAWSAHRISSALVANQMVALLGGNLSSAIKNTSQFLNEATVSGLPTAIKGLFNMAPLTGQGKALRALRKEARFQSGFKELAHDHTIWGHSDTFTDIAMHPFNTMETTMRGTSFNVYAGERLEKLGVRSLDELERVAPEVIQDIVTKGVAHANDVNHLYGVAGRSGLMMTPLVQVGMALQSYSWKQMEFISRQMKEGGGNFARYLALQGWSMRNLEALGGINGENWLGWGFLPPKGVFGRGPTVELLWDSVGALYARNEGNEKEFKARIDKIRGNLRGVGASFGADPNDPTSVAIQTVTSAAATMGAIPLPVVAIGKLNATVEQLLTGQKESVGGRTWRPITPEEAITSHFFRMHEAVEGQRLRMAQRKVRLQMDGELRSRINNLFEALEGDDGEKVTEAAAKLAEPVKFNIPITTEFIQGMFVSDERTARPTMSMINQRIRNEAKRRSVASPVNEMLDAGWVQSILLAMYMERAMRDIELGAVRNITGGQR